MIGVRGGRLQRIRKRLEAEGSNTSTPTGEPAPKRARGGRIQRQKQTSAGAPWDGTGPDPNANAIREYRKLVIGKYLDNRDSAKNIKEELQKSERAGAKGISDLTIGAAGKNSQRAMMRALLKDCSAPSLYYATIPTKNPKTGATGIGAEIPCLLPSEVLHNMLASNPGMIKQLASTPMPSVKNHLLKISKKNKIAIDSILAIGFFGDGVPSQKKRTTECYTWNIVHDGVVERRFPFCLIDKNYICDCGCHGRCTVDAILEVLLWDLRNMFTGKFPTQRHDNTCWRATDNDRTNRPRPMGFRAILGQIRGDWQWYNTAFSFPQWGAHNVCWRCEAGRDHPWDDFSLGASWRRHRLTAEAFWQRMKANNVDIGPLFAAPGFELELVAIDVLHACDLGCSQDAVGNVMWEALEKLLQGPNRNARLQRLQLRMKGFYKMHKSPAQIDHLTIEMIKKDGKSPKLRCCGAETRHAVPFALELAQDMHAKFGTHHTQAMLSMISRLFDFYMNMSLGEGYNQNWGAEAARKFCLLYKSLSDEAKSNGLVQWRCKPKMPMFLEMAEFQALSMGNPRLYWNYRDENFVGWLSKLSFRF